ncbi:hypothetical protein MSG28_000469, partial [Choristoneura fumiferana]
MSSLKMLACINAGLILLFGLTLALPEQEQPPQPDSTTSAGDDGPRGNCSCGGFPTATPNATQQPLLSQTPGLVVKCGDEGNNTCKNLCTALATATKAKGPEILCNRLNNCDELKLSAFYKICDGPWVYADMTAEEPLCCEDSKVKTCASTKTVNATQTVDANTP